MASAKKVQWAQLKVGVLSIAALIVVGVLVFLMTGERGFFAEDVTVHTYLADSYAITGGAPVRLNGILVGSVSDVQLSGDSTPGREIRVSMKIDEKMLAQIPTDSEVSPTSESILGTRYLNIKRGVGSTMVEPEGEIPSLDTRAFDEVVASGYEALTSLQGILGRLEAIVADVEEGQGSIGKFLKDEALYENLNSTVAAARELTEALNRGEGTIGQLLQDETLYADLRDTVSRLSAIADQVESGEGTLGKLIQDPAIYDEARDAISGVNQIVAGLNSGQGTAGKLLKDEELHGEIARAVDQLNTVLEKVNTGEGTLGQLLVNPQLYESLNGATYEMHEMMKDFRANPRKFLRIKLALF